MQMTLPIFSKELRFITSTLGFQERDGLVYYFLSNLPIYTHEVEDRRSFRYITSNFVLQGLCTRKDISIACNVTYDSVKKNVQKLKKEGVEGFFQQTPRTGGGNIKIIGNVQKSIQEKLNNHQSVLSIAKEESLSEGAIRAAIKRGTLKKKKLI